MKCEREYEHVKEEKVEGRDFEIRFIFIRKSAINVGIQSKNVCTLYISYIF